MEMLKNAKFVKNQFKFKMGFVMKSTNALFRIVFNVIVMINAISVMLGLV